MENNQKDFMKNRPVVSGANQIKDVYGTAKKSSRTTLTIVLAVILLICTVLSIIGGKIYLTVIFAPLFVLLLISALFSYKVDRSNRPVEHIDHPDAIFKDHEE